MRAYVCDLRMCVYASVCFCCMCEDVCLACVHLCGVCVCVRLRCVCTCVYMYLCVLCVHLCSGMYGGGARVCGVCVCGARPPGTCVSWLGGGGGGDAGGSGGPAVGAVLRAALNFCSQNAAPAGPLPALPPTPLSQANVKGVSFQLTGSSDLLFF